VTQLIRSTKQSYFKDKIEENKNNSMKLWNLTKCLSNDEKSAESGIKHLKEKEVNILVLIKYCRDLNLFCVVQPKKLAAALGQDVGSNFR